MSDFYFDTSTYVFSQQLFIQFLGFSYFCAFWSLFVQVLGLYGSKGIIPAQSTLLNLKNNYRIKNLYFKVPTLFWVNASDRTLRMTAAFGMIISALVILNIFPVFLLPILWITYLSFQNIGVVFLSFQWDVLLLEVGFIGIFFAMLTPPPLMLLIALWLLLFRFMFSSGVVKLLSGCPEWRRLKAMTYHYETQPIPNKIAYYMHQMPKWFTRLSEGGVYFFELVVPFLIFGTNELRVIACLLLVFFQLLIIATGNYAFFNVLSIALCLTLLDNSSLEWLFGPYLQTTGNSHRFLYYILDGIGLIFIFLNIIQFLTLFVSSWRMQKILSKFGAYYIISSYGLFARMTTTRDEIIVEGSEDGKEWKVYEFKWKPGDPTVAPKQVAPYHPRLDWQMWFAALSSFQHNPWFKNFLIRLLEGSSSVTELIKTNPFPNTPPKFVRARLYRYHFSDLKTKQATGEWWTRTFKGFYTPTLTLTKHQADFEDDLEF